MNASNLTDERQGSFVNNSIIQTSFKQGIYWAVASVALSGNVLLCIALLRQRRDVFRKPYTTVVFALALTDILTALFLFLSPRYVFNDTFPQPSTTLGLGAYCQLLWGRTPLFFFGVVSLFLCVLLTLERWCAVVFPTKYRDLVTIKRAIGGVFVCCVIAVTVVAISAPIIEYHPERPPGRRCSFTGAKGTQWKVASTVAFLFKSVIPCFAIVALYAHMVYKLKTGSLVAQQHNSEVKKRITKVAAIASLLQILCWIPHQVINK